MNLDRVSIVSGGRAIVKKETADYLILPRRPQAVLKSSSF